MEYYSAIKKNAFESMMRWMKLEPIIQSEVKKKRTVYERKYKKLKESIRKKSICFSLKSTNPVY